MHFPPTTIDLGFSHAVQTWQPQWLTLKMKLITSIISPEVMFIVGVLLVWYFWLHRKHPKSTLTAAAILAGNIWTLVVKDVIQRPRPIPSDVHILIHETGFSFPSGHAVGIVLLVAAWYVLTPKRWRIDVLALSGLVIAAVGYSRIYLGVHWLTDVLAGYGIALLWVAIVLLVAGRTPSRR